MSNFSETIRKLLKDRDLTASELARMTGYTPQYIHDLINGNRRWNEVTITKTCDALGLEISITPKAG